MIVLTVPVLAALLAFLTIPLCIAVRILVTSRVILAVLAVSLRAAVPILIASLVILTVLARFAVLAVSVVTALLTVLPVPVLTALLALLTVPLRIAVPVLITPLVILALLTALTSAVPVILALSGFRLFRFLSGLLLLFFLELLKLLHFLSGQINLVLLAMSAAELQLFHRILLNLLFVTLLDNDLDKLTQNINTLHLALQTVLRSHIISDSGQLTV